MNRSFHILLVEDNPGDADLTRESFTTDPRQLSIAVAIDGIDALAYLLRRPPHEDAPSPHVVLLDLNLPMLGGLEVLAAIRSHHELRKVPVVILTSSDAESDIVKSYELGASCYSTKPVGLEAYQRVVQELEHFWLSVVKIP